MIFIFVIVTYKFKKVILYIIKYINNKIYK